MRTSIAYKNLQDFRGVTSSAETEKHQLISSKTGGWSTTYEKPTSKPARQTSNHKPGSKQTTASHQARNHWPGKQLHF